MTEKNSLQKNFLYGTSIMYVQNVPWSKIFSCVGFFFLWVFVVLLKWPENIANVCSKDQKLICAFY